MMLIDPEQKHMDRRDTFRRGILKGNTAQWLVFLNGLVLTFTAYFALSYFIKQSIQEDYRRAASDTMQEVSGRFSDLEYSIRTAAGVVSDLKDRDEHVLTLRLASSVPHLELLNRLIWIRKLPGGTSEQWEALDLYNNDRQQTGGNTQITSFAGLTVPGLANLLKSGISGSRSDIAMVSNLPNADYLRSTSDPDIQDRALTMVRALRTEDGEIESMVVGITKVGTVLNTQLLTQPNIVHLAIHEQATGRPLFEMMRHKPPGLETDSTTIAMVGGVSLQVALNLSQYNGAAILGKIPLLLLLFGCSLTIIGTLYIRSNQQQSMRLANMNRVLAKKNYELNSEVIERERLNESMQNAEREYRAIVNSVSDVIFETNTDGEIIFLNSAWERITGFDISQSIKRNLFDMLHQQDQEEQRQQFKSLVRGKRNAYRGYTRLRSSDGGFRSVEISLSMLRVDESRKTRVVGSFTDVEERRRAEHALSEAEKKYRAIVENAAGGIFQMTPEGQFLSANPSLARILGFETAEGMLREVRNAFDYLFFSSKDRARFMRDLTASGLGKNIEVQGRNREGQKIWLNINARAVRDNENNILYFEGSLENITMRKDGETQLREAKIQSDLSSRAKSEFLTNMSHELRTPLNAIIGFSEIIKNEVLGKLENRQYWEYSNDIYNSGRKLLGIINEILDVSRIEAGDRQLTEGSVDMVKLVSECVGFMSARIRESNLKLTNLIEGNVAPIIGEELAIKQVLINLLSNAVKFTPDGGRITLSYEIDHDGQMRVSVTDTGIGLNEMEIEKALSPFGQIDVGFSRSGSGTGLGLTLVDSLIKLHGGQLELFSQKGIGTTATVIFPAKRVGAVPTGEEASRIVPGGDFAEKFDLSKLQ